MRWVSIAIFFFVPFACAGEHLGPEDDPCSFYDRKATDLGCGVKNYLIDFGARYCRQFRLHQDEYSSLAQRTLPAIRECLIERLAERADLTCANVQSIALASHVGCYLEHGFCDLGWADRGRILLTVREHALRPGFRATMGRIMRGCSR